jgi:4-amino-4-deoxy-L-arabinose transferase-like glycosyltransferase
MLKPSHNPWFAPAVAFACAVIIYSINLGRPPHPDELHHVIAAQDLLETGRPTIAEGEYWRGILQTWLVALSYAVFGQGLISARIPSVIAVALVVAILHVWVRRESSSSAAWLTTFLFATSPYAVEIAQFCRFYALQLLFFTTGSIALFYLVLDLHNRWRTALLAVLTVGLLALATSLQVTSLIGILGLVSWMGSYVLQKVVLQIAPPDRFRYGLVGLLVIASILIACDILFCDEAKALLERYQSTPLFAADTSNDFWYYHLRYHLFYPSLWPVVALLAVFAIAKSPRIGWFSTVVFAISFLLTSFAAQKATRYFSYAQPYLAIVWGLGLVSVLPVLSRHFKECGLLVVKSTGLLAGQSVRIVNLVAIVLVATVVLANPFWLRSATMIANAPLPIETPMTDWRAARTALAPWTRTADIMITTEELGAIYFLGRSDVRFSRSKFGELRPDQKFEFGMDVRTGRPIISQADSVELLMRCFSKGFIVGPREHWGSPILIDNEVQAVIRANAQPIVVPRTSYLYAWGWDRPAELTKPATCDKLPDSLGKNQRGDVLQQQ